MKTLNIPHILCYSTCSKIINRPISVVSNSINNLLQNTQQNTSFRTHRPSANRTSSIQLSVFRLILHITFPVLFIKYVDTCPEVFSAFSLIENQSLIRLAMKIIHVQQNLFCWAKNLLFFNHFSFFPLFIVSSWHFLYLWPLLIYSLSFPHLELYWWNSSFTVSNAIFSPYYTDW